MAEHAAGFWDASTVIYHCYTYGASLLARRIVLECVRHAVGGNGPASGRSLLRLTHDVLEQHPVEHLLARMINASGLTHPEAETSFAMWACYHTAIEGRMHSRLAILHALSHAAVGVDFPHTSVTFQHTLNAMGMDTVQLQRWEREAQTYRAIARDLLYRPLSDPLPASFYPTLRAIPAQTQAMARTIFAEEDWRILPVLADALEDDGVSDSRVLQHLRSRGPHFRGCWALELVRMS